MVLLEVDDRFAPLVNAEILVRLWLLKAVYHHLVDGANGHVGRGVIPPKNLGFVEFIERLRQQAWW